MSLLLALVLCLGMVPGVALAEDVSYTQVTSADQFTTGQYYMVTDTGHAPGVLDGTWVTAVEVTDGIVPEGAIWTLAVNDGTVTLTDANGVSIAPKGSNENGIVSGQYSWNWTFQGGKFTFTGHDKDTVILASNKSSQHKFRAYKTTTVSGNPNGYPSEFTLYKAVSGSQGTTVAAPQASPQAGAVTSGTAITLTCTTADAQIYYTLDGSEPTSESTLYSEDNKLVIEGDEGDTVTLKAVAVKDGVSSAVQTLTYTIQSDEPAAAPIADGDQVVIYAPAYNMALSSEKTGHYNVGTDITVGADGTLGGYTASDIWTVIANDNGTFSFQQNGQNIGLGDSFASMNLGETHDDW